MVTRDKLADVGFDHAVPVFTAKDTTVKTTTNDVRAALPHDPNVFRADREGTGWGDNMAATALAIEECGDPNKLRGHPIDGVPQDSFRITNVDEVPVVEYRDAITECHRLRELVCHHQRRHPGGVDDLTNQFLQ